MNSELQEAAGIAARAAVVVKRLRPPDDENRAVTAWRWFIVVAVTVNSVLLLAHMVISYGWILNSGFATTQEVSDMRKDIKLFKSDFLQWKIDRIETRIYNLRINQCDAIYHNENPRLYTLQLNDATRQYRHLAQNDAYLASCEEVEESKHGDPKHNGDFKRDKQPMKGDE